MEDHTHQFGYIRKPFNDVNDKQRPLFSSQDSLKSSTKSFESSIEDSQDSGVSCGVSPSQFGRVKKIAVRHIKSPGSVSKSGSFESEGEMDIGEVFQEDFELPPIPDSHDPNIASLLFGQIKNKGCSFDIQESNEENFMFRKDVARRIGNMYCDGTPPSSKSYDLFKRPCVPGESITPVGHTKRMKSVSQGNICDRSLNRSRSAPAEEDVSSEDDACIMELDNSFEAAPPPRTKLYQRSQSESAVSIMKAVESFDNDPMMIGDATRRFVLPLVANGKHNDLKEISAETLVKLMNGEYSHVVNNFQVIDCRYPYEYHGGHIQGAINIHTQKQLHERYLLNRSAVDTSNASKERNILVFHCEFSSQRAPDLCRFLREADRKCNVQSFPALHYPELYVLHGGYKAFFEMHKSYCDPQYYLEMNDPKYTEECKMHKTKSKTDVVSTKTSSSTNVMKSQRKATFKKYEFENC